MKNTNCLILSGRLGKDAEVRFIPSGDPVCTFSICVAETWKNKAGEKQERSFWIEVVHMGTGADKLGALLKKGMGVTVTGSLNIRTYDDKDGNKRWVTECKIGFGGNIEITAWPKDSKQGTGNSGAPEDNDLPF